MTHQQFMSSPELRRRYWARSFAGWGRFVSAQPNAGHAALAALQRRGWVHSIVTQNVDRLHHKAGSAPDRLIELHGTTHEVVCTACAARLCRKEFHDVLAGMNPRAAADLEGSGPAHPGGATSPPPVPGQAAGISLASLRPSEQLISPASLRPSSAPHSVRPPSDPDALRTGSRSARPDGDFELGDAGARFQVPTCSSCGSDGLKPDVVFFGDNVPKEKVCVGCSSFFGGSLTVTPPVF